MKVLFKEIRGGDLAAVTARLDDRPDLVHAIATAPPKKDDGQSPLQVAFKCGQFPIARLLIDRGADVAFMESSAINAWRTPVLHDAIRATVFSTRWGRNRALRHESPRIEWFSTLERFEEALALLANLLARGADPRQTDSFGNPALMRAVLDARQLMNGDSFLPETREDLPRVFALLLAAGADPAWVDHRTGETLSEMVAATPIEPMVDPPQPPSR